MYDYSCNNAGAVACGYALKAESEQELRAQVSEHARTKHDVKQMSDTIFNFMRDTAKR